MTLYREVQGEGPLLVLVHGSWADHTNWIAAAALLAERFRVVSYDRRAHSLSGGGGDAVLARRRHEDDLAALIESVGGGDPAFVAGNSYGGAIALGLAARRPELVRGVTVHEPPLVGLLPDGGPLAELAAGFSATLDAVVGELDEGRVERGTRRFVEEIALGPGGWELLPERARAVCLANAGAFRAEMRDPDWASLDVGALGELPGRIVVTKGDAGPLFLSLLADRVASRVAGAELVPLPGAGHVPHLSHPEEYARLVAGSFEQVELGAGRA